MGQQVKHAPASLAQSLSRKVFWDYENMAVPQQRRNLSGAQLVHAIKTSILSVRKANDEVRQILLISDVPKITVILKQMGVRNPSTKR